MGYSHTFYAVDLDRLRSIPGSKDMALFDEIEAKADSPDDPDLEGIRRIIMGECEHIRGHEPMYGYALGRICGHIGELVVAEVAAVRDHPYKSLLVSSGPPIDIPYDRADAPQIGYIENAKLAKEYKLATETEPKVKKSLTKFLVRRLLGKLFVGREMDEDDLAEDMKEYAEVLKVCMEKNASLVSLRH